MDIFIYFIFISFAVYIQICEALYGCNESIPTISYVESCPKNKTEWNIAARRKNCDSLAGLQKCTEPENFQYHCLENQWQTMTLEICAPIFYLQGYCATYNTDKKRVDENYDNGFKCLEFDKHEKCTTRYPSTDAYKYQRCYKLKNQNPTPLVTKKDLRSNTADSIKTAFLVILALALAGVIVFFIILFYKRKSLYLERFFNVWTCDEETGSVDGTDNENEEKTKPEGDPNDICESLHLLTKEDKEDKRASATSDKDPARKGSTSLESAYGNNPFEEDTQPSDFAVVSNSSSNAMPVIGIALSSATISSDITHSSSTEVPSSTPRVYDDLNSDKDIVSNISDNVPTSGQTSDIVIASKQEPVDDVSSKPKQDNESASTQKSNTFLHSTSNLDTKGIMKAKSDDPSLPKLKPTDVSLQQVKLDAKNTSKPSERENEPTEISIPENNKTEDKSQDANEKKFKENLSNDNPAPDSCASKPMSAINPFDEDSTPSATSEKDPAPNDSTNLKPISGNNPFEEDTPTLGFGKLRKAPRPPPHVTKIDEPQNASLQKGKAPPPQPPTGQPKYCNFM